MTFHRIPCPGDTSYGSGLGLAITKGFVELNGGRIKVESVVGQGTTFVVEFPVAEQVPVTVGAGDDQRTAG